MTFNQPIWLFLGLLFCLFLFFLLRWMETRSIFLLKKFASADLLASLTRSISPRHRLVKKMCLLLALFLCFLAISRPQYGTEWIEVKRKGIDILFALDTSKSMLAEDTMPNRIERAKLAILDFVNQLEGDRVGLMPFAGAAFLMCPLTLDYTAFKHSLRAIDGGIIPKGGTDLSEALLMAETVFADDANHKILILLTDGENHHGNLIEAASQVTAKNLTVFTVGVGTKSGGLIPTPPTIKEKFLKDGSGDFVTSRLDDSLLRKLAEKTGGIYTPLGVRGEGLEVIYKEKLQRIPQKELKERRKEVPIERFVYPLAAALPLLIIDFVLSGRKSDYFLRFPFFNAKKINPLKSFIKIGICVGLLLLFAGAIDSFASAGFKAYKSGDYTAALQLFSEKIKDDPENPWLHYNYGTAAYKQQMYGSAITSFNKALISNNLSLQQRVYYNLGVAQFQKGRELSEKKKTLEFWQRAVISFSSSIKLNPSDLDALQNKRYVEKRIEELKKKRIKLKMRDKENTQEKSPPKNEFENIAGEEKGTKGKDPQRTDIDPPKMKSVESEQNLNDPGENRNPEQTPQLKLTEGKKQEKFSHKEKQRADIKDQQPRTRKMSRDEAEKLFNAMKNDEETLAFIPVTGSTKNDKPRKDW